MADDVTATRAAAAPQRAFMRTPWSERVWSGVIWGSMTLFIVNVALMIAAVATNSFARRWLGTWLPQGWTTTWYVDAWKEFQLGSVLWVTVEVVFAVVFLALVIGEAAEWETVEYVDDWRQARNAVAGDLVPVLEVDDGQASDGAG